MAKVLWLIQPLRSPVERPRASDHRQATRMSQFDEAQPEISYRWIDDDAAFGEVVEQLCAIDRFALDTEFHRERTFYPRLALMQLAWNNGADIVLVDPVAVDMSALAPALRSAGTVLMHAGQQDLEVLVRACDTVPTHLFDTQIAAGFVGLSSPSLSTLSDRFLKLRLPKGDRLTDWFQRPLNDAQRRYAAADVAYLEEIHDLLVEDLDQRGRHEWALAECEVLRAKDVTGGDPKQAWTKIKETKHLRGQARGVALEVAAWRDATARSTDQPVRFVLPDLALVGISQKAPKSIDSLRSVRGLDGRHLRGGAGQQILDAVERGQSVPAADVEAATKVQSSGIERRLRPAVTLVSAWISQLARDEDLDPALLATRADLVDYLRGDSDARLRKGWRQELVGSRITALVDGEAALAFDDGRLVLVDR